MIYGPVAGLLFHTLTEEANFMPKLYSWIAVPPETVVRGKVLPSHPLLPGLGSGTGAGLVPFLEFQCQEGAPGRAGSVIQTENLIPRPLLPKKAPAGRSRAGCHRAGRRWRWLWRVARPRSHLLPLPGSCPRAESKSLPAAWGERPTERSVP